MSYTDFDFPHTSLYQSDLREILAQMNKLTKIVKDFVNVEKVTFADPILWNIATQYSKNTIVLSVSGDAYLSKQPVPSGVQLDNEDYWQEIFNFADYVRTANENLTFNVEQNTTRSERAYHVDDWLLWNDILYKVIAEIAVDDLLVVGTNVEHFTVEDFIKAFMTWATNTIQQYKNDIDASEVLYRQQLAGDIANTTASLQAQLDLAISGATVDSEVINARLGGDGVTYPTLGDATRTQFYKSLHCLNIMVTSSNLSTYPDANNYPENSIFLVNPAVAASVAHTPYTTCGYLINTYSYLYNAATPHGGMFQVAYPWANNTEYVKMRSHDGSSWGAWRKTTPIEANDFIQSAGIGVYNASSLASYPDVNNYPMNKIILVQAAYASQVSHSPFSSCAYNVLTTGYVYAGSPYGGAIQIAVPLDNNEPVKYRFNGGTWGSWRTYIANIDDYLRSGRLIITSATDVSNYPDLDNYPMNKIILVNYNQAPNVAHSPFTDCSYEFISTGPYYSNAPYGGMIQIAIPSLLSEGKTIVWRSHDGTNFTDWQSAGGNVFKANNTNFIEVINTAKLIANSTVELEGGTYNLFDATHDETYWKNARPATRYTGLVIGNGLKIIGKGEVIFDAQYTGSDSDIMENFSIFNVSGDCTIKNIKMKARNICYCIHDDSAIVSADESICTFENCMMEHLGTTHTFLYGAPICIGGGTTDFIEREIINNYFDANNFPFSVSYHEITNGRARINIEHNYFKDSCPRFAASGSGGTIDAFVVDNRLHSAIAGTTETGVTVYKWNNVIE